MDQYFAVVLEASANTQRLTRRRHLFVGTLRPDLIESASKLASSHADAIKTHHNDTDLVRALRAKGRVLEPLKDFHKDEVRELGRRLGLPDSAIMRFVLLLIGRPIIDDFDYDAEAVLPPNQV